MLTRWITKTYNVLEKLRSGEALTPQEREIHQIAACGVLKYLHDELDRLVAEAYGWPWPMKREEILERLVVLHDERVEEEKQGIIRWLRPEYQIPRFAKSGAPTVAPTLELEEPAPVPQLASKRPWPASTVEQIAALHTMVSATPLTAEEAAAAFENAKPELARRHLETLAMVGEVRCGPDGRYTAIAMAV